MRVKIYIATTNIEVVELVQEYSGNSNIILPPINDNSIDGNDNLKNISKKEMAPALKLFQASLLSHLIMPQTNTNIANQQKLRPPNEY